ncbi:phosphoadenosine phosphosulfate reductase family protein [Escherichia coli]
MAAQLTNPVMMYSIGKDSTVMLHLARKAFYRVRSLSPCCMSIPTGNSGDVSNFRDDTAKAYGCELLVHKNPDGVAMGINPFVQAARNTPTL